jgi:hypothetical protein
MKNLIQYDETEWQDSLTYWALDWITHLYGAEMADLLDPEVVPIDVGSSGHNLRSDLLRTS